MRSMWFTLLMALLAAIDAAAQNPCTDVVTGVAIDPTRVYATLSQQTLMLADGSPAVEAYEFGFMLQSATEPTQFGQVVKTAWSLVDGTDDCYTAPWADFGAIPIGGPPWVMVLRARRGEELSVWSEISNPFGLAGLPVSPAHLRIRR